jgi:hypothetical protein
MDKDEGVKKTALGHAAVIQSRFQKEIKATSWNP